MPPMRIRLPRWCRTFSDRYVAIQKSQVSKSETWGTRLEVDNPDIEATSALAQADFRWSAAQFP
jgi:hypothetical protein